MTEDEVPGKPWATLACTALGWTEYRMHICSSQYLFVTWNN